MADARSNIAMKLEMYEGKEVMQEEEHVAVYGATCAITLSLPSDINGTGRIAIADCWFGSFKTFITSKESDLYSVKLVKKAHKQFPQESLDSHDFTVGKWVAYTAKSYELKSHPIIYCKVETLINLIVCRFYLASVYCVAEHYYFNNIVRTPPPPTS